MESVFRITLWLNIKAQAFSMSDSVFFLTGTHEFSQDESHTGPTIIICHKIIENTFNCVLLLGIEVSMVREIAIVISSNNYSG